MKTPVEDFHVEIDHGIEHLKIMKNLHRIVSTDDGMTEVDPVMMIKNRDHAKEIDLDQEMIHKKEIVRDHVTMLQEDSHLKDPDHGITHQMNHTRPTPGIVRAPEISPKNDMNVEEEVHHLQIRTGELWMKLTERSRGGQEYQYLKCTE